MDYEKNLSEEFEKPSRKEKIAFFLEEAGGGGLVYYIVLTLSTFFYTDVMYLPAATIGTIILVSRIFDAWSDMFVGSLVDRTNTKWGKARPWVLIMNIPCVISMVLMYCAPTSLSLSAQIAYVIITYNLTVTVFFTAWSIPFGISNTLITRDSKERTKLASLRMCGSTLGGVLGTSIALPVINMLGGDRVDWIKVMTGFAIFCVICNVWCVMNYKERVKDDPEAAKDKIKNRKDLPSALRNKYFYVAISLNAMFSLFNVGCSTMQTYYSKYILGNTMITVTLNAVQQALMAVTCLACVVLIERFNKVSLIKFGMILTLPGQLLLALAPTSVAMVIFATALRSIGWGILGGSMYGCIMDACEYGHWRTGHRAAGTVYASSGLGNKLGVMFGSGLYPLLMGLSGYNGASEVQSTSAMAMISNLYIWAPAVLAIVMLVIMFNYKLEKMYPSIMADLTSGKFHPKAMYIDKPVDDKPADDKPENVVKD